MSNLAITAVSQPPPVVAVAQRSTPPNRPAEQAGVRVEPVRSPSGATADDLLAAATEASAQELETNDGAAIAEVLEGVMQQMARSAAWVQPPRAEIIGEEVVAMSTDPLNGQPTRYSMTEGLDRMIAFMNLSPLRRAGEESPSAGRTPPGSLLDLDA